MKKNILSSLSALFLLLACQNLPPAHSEATAIQNTDQQEQAPIWDANTVVLTSKKLAPNVFAIYDNRAETAVPQGVPMATSSGFIIGEKGVVLIDTMLNKRLHDQVRALIRNETEKPIIYAINTSYHGDHMYGNMYLADSTQIVQHSKAQSYMSANLAQDKAFMIENFGKGRGIEEIELRNGDILVQAGETYTLDLGDRKIKIIDFGFAQTGGDLFVWDEIAKVMWTGNPIIAHQPALPWLLDGHLIETLNSLKAMYEFLPPDVTVVPGHGVPMRKSDLNWHLNYLESIKTQVESAVAQGLSEEETVKQVSLENFRGYQLFDWVHPGLNVPAAYKDLAQ